MRIRYRLRVGAHRPTRIAARAIGSEVVWRQLRSSGR